MEATGIAAGQGKTGEIGGRPVAVFNSGDELVVLENVCTHMGCQTSWNTGASTWDCPCHGSRYHPDGTVLNGPAPVPLPRLSYRVEDGEIVLE